MGYDVHETQKGPDEAVLLFWETGGPGRNSPRWEGLGKGMKEERGRKERGVGLGLCFSKGNRWE